jgi:TetR/AcrR family transcriptional regulator of autoinduction and epiphytic fitness
VERVAVDGRTARAQRTREAIVAANVDLIGEGESKPTAERIAERAGVSVRALWTHFADMEALLESTAAVVLDRQESRFRPVDVGLDRADRIVAFARQRASLLEWVAPFARSSQLREELSPVLRDYRNRHIRLVAEEIRMLFAPELAGLGRTARGELVAALAAATTWGAWTSLRDHLGLSRRRSQAVLVRTVTALLDDASPPRRRPKASR